MSTPQKFRKKPVEVVAYQFGMPATRPQRGPDVNNPGIEWFDWGSSQQHPTVVTLHGRVRVEDGDWVIQGPFGDYWPCKPDIFEATYEPAERGTTGGEG